MDITGFAFFGGGFANILMSDVMVRFVLPFLLIFAVVFAILTKTGVLGTQREILAIVSLAVGLLALQFDIVSNFYSVIFPRFGVWLSVFLIVLIFMGLFAMDFKRKGIIKIFLAIGGVIAVIVTLESFSASGYWGSSWIYQYMDEIIWGGLLITLIMIVISTGAKPEDSSFFEDIGEKHPAKGKASATSE